MSTVVSSFLKDRVSEKQLATERMVEGAIKVWCIFNGTGTPAITSSWNASSITDSGVGVWNVNFITALTAQCPVTQALTMASWTNTATDCQPLSTTSAFMRHVENGAGYDTSAMQLLVAGRLA